MKASVKILVAAACGCAVLLFACWCVVCGGAIFSREDGFSDARKSLDVRLEALGTYLTELAAAWRTYGDV